MTYTASINNGYIDFIGTKGGNIEIDETRFNEIKQTIESVPSAPQGFAYRLKADTLTLELVELPPIDDTDEEATESDYIDALQDLGVEIET